MASKIATLFLLSIAFKCSASPNSAVMVHYILSANRFGSPVRYDHYFSCTACGQSLQWRVNDLDAGSHFIADTVGQARYRTDNNEIRYLSILMAKTQINSDQCLNAILLVSGTTTEILKVLCRGDTEQDIAINSNISMIVDSKEENDVFIDYVFNKHTVIILKNSIYITYVFICKASGSSQSWLINGRSSGGIVTQNSIGKEVVQRHANDEDLVYSEVVLLANKPSEQTLTALLVLSEMFNISGLQITCRSDTTELSIDIFLPHQMTITSISSENTTTATTNLSVVSYNSGLQTYLSTVLPNYSSAPLPPSGEPDTIPISNPGQICYERVLPSQDHFYKIPEPPKCTGDVACPLPLDAVGFVSKLWKNNDLLVYFMSPNPQEDEILEWANEWSKYCAIIFYKTLKQESSDLRVAFDNSGSWSYIGTDALHIPKESKTMNLGFIDRSTVMHEFGHALGLIHEHQSPFKGGFEWNKEEVIKSLSGPPNYWDLDRIENNMFRSKRKDLDGTLYDSKSIMHYSYPREWIKGDGYPDGIDRNTQLSPRDKEHVKHLYGPSRLSNTSTGSRGTGRVFPAPERVKPVISLPTPSGKTIHDIQVYESHRGELSGQGAELILRFHTSETEQIRYTIQTHGDCDMVVALLGPDDYIRQILVDDDSGDGLNSKVSTQLFPDRDYFVQIQTFDPKGGKFKFSITSW